MRRIGKMRRKKQKKIIIVSALSLILFLTVGYAAFSTNLSITAKGNVKEKSRVIQAWDINSQTDFHSDYYKQNIVNATFLDNANVPSNATESWNVSEDKTHGGVMAWVVPNNEDSTKYDLYVGAKDGVVANEDSSDLFSEFRNLVSINFNNNYDTSQAIKMERMFLNCTSLIALDLTTFDTRNVTSMLGMFCMWDSNLNDFPQNVLASIEFGQNFKTDNVTDMRSMFAGLNKLKSLDVSSFNTSKVTTMYHMFTGCQSLVTLDVSHFDTSQVTNMQQMFNNCSSLTSLNLSNFNTSKVTDMSCLFWDCRNLTSLNLCSFNTRNVKDMSYMFRNTFKLNSVYVGSNWSTSQANITNMFYNSNISSVTTGQC